VKKLRRARPPVDCPGLKIARAFGVKVEDVFQLADFPPAA